MTAVNSEIAAILAAEVTALNEEISSFLFNEPLEQDSVTDLLNKLHGVCRLMGMEAAVVLVDEIKKTINFIVDKGNSLLTFQPELSAILDTYPRLFKVFHQTDVSSPFLFMPELAVLRRIQGLPPLYEFQMVKNHSWPPGSRFKGMTELSAESSALLKKLKQLYQMGLLEILRGKDQHKGADMIAKVAAKLRQVFTSDAESNYWSLVEYVALGFRDGQLSFNGVRMRLLAAVERQLKTLLDGVSDSTKAYPLGLWRAYGILLALIPGKTGKAEALCEWVGAPDFGFTDTAMHETRDLIFGKEDAGLEAVVSEISSRLGNLHNILELIDSQGHLSEDESREFGRLVGEIATLCAENGLTRAAARFNDHHAYIRAASGETWQPGSMLLRDTAHSILYLECLLLNLREGGAVRRDYIARLDVREVDDVVEEKLVHTSIHAVWAECLRKLASTKEILDEIVTDMAGAEVSATLLGDLEEIEGAARVVGEAQVVDIVRRCRRFVSDRLFALDGDDKSSLMASFADAVVALEYYFQNTSRGDKSDFVLDIADDYLAVLEAA